MKMDKKTALHDLQAIKEGFMEDTRGSYPICLDYAIEAVANQKPEGKWIDCGVAADGFPVFKCSVCGRIIATYQPLLNNFPFCHCGAEMQNAKEEVK